MGMGGGGARGAIKNDINVTPLVDVVLVLLIIFMVITPMLQKGKQVNLPKATKIDKPKGAEEEALIVSITAEKEVFIEQDKFSDEDFTAEISTKLIASPGRKIMLKGDDSLTFEDVRKVMQLAQKGGAKAIALGVEEEAKTP